MNYVVSVAGVAGAATPTGTVQVSDGSTDCQFTLSSGSGNCSLGENEGGYSISASFMSADSNYLDANGSADETVGQGLPTVGVTPQSGAKTGLVSYAVTVTGVSGAAVPTGSVQISDASTSCTANLSVGPTNASMSCSLAEGAGSYSVTAAYSGDTNYSSATGSGMENVAKATASWGTPGVVTPTTAGLLTYSINLVGNSSIVPTGTVTVDDLDIRGTGSCTITLLGGAGSCSFLQHPALAANQSYSIQFIYNGDSNYVALTGTASKLVTQQVTVAPVNVSVTASANPAAAASASGDATVTYSVQVAAVTTTGFGDPTGGATVSDGTLTCAINNLVSGAGQCKISEPFSTSGYSVTASYGGDENYNSGSASLTEFVGSRTTTTYSRQPTGTIAPNGSVTFSETVTPRVLAAGTPSGDVQFVVDGGTAVDVTLTDGVATLDYQVPSGTPKGTETVVATFQSSNPGTWFNSQKTGFFKVS